MLFITKEEQIQIGTTLQILYFYASWMPFHRKYLTMIEKIEDTYKDISFCAIDVDQFRSQCKRFAITSIPAVLIIQGGRETQRILGAPITSVFKRAFADICID
jgi:thioredoxin-like negative regulator of GroEL